MGKKCKCLMMHHLIDQSVFYFSYEFFVWGKALVFIVHILSKDLFLLKIMLFNRHK